MAEALHRTPAPLPERQQRKRHRLSRLLDRLADQLRHADLTLNNNHYQPCLMLDTVYLPTPALAVKCEPQETPLDLSIKPEPPSDGRESPPQIVPQQLPAPRVPLTEKSPAVERTVVEQNGGELAYVCSACGQMFSLHDRLAKHVASRHRSRKSSESNRAYECGVCSRRFARSDMLTRHARLHSGLKPYTCGSCGQVFSRSDHLATHQRTHTGEKPYKCPLCPYAACRRDMITRHMRTHARIPNLPQTSAA